MFGYVLLCVIYREEMKSSEKEEIYSKEEKSVYVK